jgi:GAF domain-containing protein
MVTKTTSKTQKAKPRSRVKASAVTQRPTYAELRQQLAESLQRESAKDKGLHEALEQQTATSEILRVIASSPTDIQPVLDTVAESAARLCDALDAAIYRIDGEIVQPVAHYGPVPFGQARRPLARSLPVGRAILDRETLHILDLAAVLETEFPDAKPLQRQVGSRTCLVTPLLRERVSIGAILIRRTEIRPFTEKQIALLKTFADQAVIAIENVRLFNELKQSLEQQTATSEILGVIASSPTDIQPVLDAVAESAARLCDAENATVGRVEGNTARPVASHGSMPVPGPRQITRGTPSGRAMLDRKTIHVHDLAAEMENEFPESRPRQELSGSRSVLATPLLREGVAIGVIFIRRREVRPFTDKQIKLLENFANQAVIAIENVRLFKELQERNAELREALEQQTATSEVLRVIASSPTELQPVLDTVITNAVRLVGGEHGHIRQYDGEFLRAVAYYNAGADYMVAFREKPLEPSRETGPGRAFLERRPIHIPDVESDPSFGRPPIRLRTILAVPMLREGTPIGTISIGRENVMPFTDRQIELVTTFADQAIIAIENVRLFNELKESLEQQTATSEILGVIASSPTEIQPVLDAVAKNAARLCESYDAVIHRVDGDYMQRVAHFGPVPVAEGRRPITRGVPMGRAIVDAQTIHVEDILAEIENDFPDTKELQQRTGTRTVLAVPLLREGVAIGVINVRRTEVRPFSDKQVKLLETFASQAAIAIENVRLFQELQARNAELREALEHQTATSEVLGIISRSPTDVQPVLDSIVESAARVCSIDDVVLRLRESDSMVPRAHFGPMRVRRVQIPIDAPQLLWMREHGTVHVPDRLEQDDIPRSGFTGSWRSLLSVPLRQQGELIGVLAARRLEVRPFTPTQIKLLETFANQAVIAIENARLFQELKESLEQQTVTSEILGVIASSPTDIQPVLDAVAESAVRLCGAEDASIRLVDGNLLRLGAHYGEIPMTGAEQDRPINRLSVMGRAVVDRQAIHIIEDLRSPSAEPEFTGNRVVTRDIHTMVATPLLRKGVAIGVIGLRRTEIRPFTDKQIALLKTFADQAAIAIENVRLFKELQERNSELREALEHQTATSEVLGIISRSPTDVQPVLDAIVESAAKVCGIDDVLLRLRDGDAMIARAHFGYVPIAHGREEISVDEPQQRWVREHGTLHIPDVREQTDFPVLGSFGNFRTFLVAPLYQRAEFIGGLTARRTEVCPFTPAQIKLLETFADQAVIAIENVRLFNELTESLEQQTATSEILSVIASSPTDIQPVLDAIAGSARRLCDAKDAVIRFVEGNVLRLGAHQGSIPFLGPSEIPINRGSVTGRAIVEGQPVHIEDSMSVAADEFPELPSVAIELDRTQLAVPLMREDVAIGAILIRRTEVNPFTEKQIALLKTFAAQAVIAIENVRLFKELEERNTELREALEHQMATSEMLGIISRSPTDVQPVLDAIVESAAKVCGIDDVVLRLREGDAIVQRAHFGPVPITRVQISVDEFFFNWICHHGTLHIPDVEEETEVPLQNFSGNWRTALYVPLRQRTEVIGHLTARRIQVSPFNPAQTKLLEIFADQAVIAIENVRLFNELKESLEQQTATSEILGIIARSPTDLQPVLDAVAESAARLCEATDASILRVDGERSCGSRPRTDRSYGSLSRGL